MSVSELLLLPLQSSSGDCQGEAGERKEGTSTVDCGVKVREEGFNITDTCLGETMAIIFHRLILETTAETHSDSPCTNQVLC